MELNTTKTDSSRPVLTAGTVFRDGASITLLSSDRLLLSSEEGELTEKVVLYKDNHYAAAPLDPVLAGMLRLPRKLGKFSDASSLAAELKSLFVSKAGLGEADALLLAMFVLATWVYDALPRTLFLNVWGPIESQSTTQQILESLCRHPLAISDPRPAEIADLPKGIDPCLILQEPPVRVLQRFMGSASGPRVCELREGRILCVQCSIAAFTARSLELPGLTIQLSSKKHVRVSQDELRALLGRLQPRLVAFRLARRKLVAKSEFDVLNFSSEVRALAQIYGAVAEGEPELQTSITAALETRDEAAKADEAQNVGTAVIEVLLALLHERKRAVRVSEVADMTNALLLNRGDEQALTAKATGTLVRSFGFHPFRDRDGYHLKLDAAAAAMVHQLAAERQARSMISPTADCRLCKNAAFAEESN